MSLIRRLPTALTALALLAGCGDSSGPLDNDQLDEIGAALRDERCEAATEALSAIRSNRHDDATASADSWLPSPRPSRARSSFVKAAYACAPVESGA